MTISLRHRSTVAGRGLAASLAIALAAVWLQAAPALAQSPAAADDYSPEAIAQRRSEQAEPRTAISLDPAAFDRFVGAYQLAPSLVLTVSRNGPVLLTRLTGQDPVQVFPESPTKFFLKVVPAQLSFVGPPSGPPTEVVLHQAGFDRHARRIPDADAKAIEATLQHRIESNLPGPGTEAALRKYIQHLEDGLDVYADMSPALAAISRVQMPGILGSIKRLGQLKTITFKNVGLQGFDFYLVEFQNGKALAGIAQLTPDGHFDGLNFRELP
jgi:hypothetical protein